MLTSFFSFHGRIGRGMWWLTGLLQFALAIAAGLYLENVDAAADPRTGWQGPVFFIIILVFCWIGLCANIKRYHDRSKSGFWVLIAFVPFIGALWMLIELGFLPGDEAENIFGPPPGSGLKSASRDVAERPSQLGKLDDAYFKQYAATLAATKAPQAQAAAPARTRSNSGARPAFGKRG
ncbi:MAG: DUF805 domain-containing protein [Hyphomicrobiaceae bacterium]